MNGTVSANPWNCSVVGQTITCTVSAAIAANTNFPDITVPVKVASGATGTITNTGSVSNPNEVDNGGVNGSGNNTDPAVITIGSIGSSCDTISSSPAASTLAPSVDVTYTCAATGSTLVPANLEYSIKCGTGDVSS
jgi:hypothetical protein